MNKWPVIISIWIIAIALIIITLRIIDDAYLGMGHRTEIDIIKDAMEAKDQYKALKEGFLGPGAEQKAAELEKKQPIDEEQLKQQLMEKYLNR